MDLLSKEDVRALLDTNMTHQLGEERLVKLLKKVVEM